MRTVVVSNDSKLPKTDAVRSFAAEFKKATGLEPHQFLSKATPMHPHNSEFREYHYGAFAFLTFEDGSYRLEYMIAGPSVPRMNPWVPETNPAALRRLGKTSEELGELGKVIGRIICQGLEGKDPDGTPNTIALVEEISDVYAQLDECVHLFGFDPSIVEARRKRKRAMVRDWESQVREHILLTTDMCGCSGDASRACPVCDGGLAVCSVCGMAEIELEDNPICPGRKET